MNKLKEWISYIVIVIVVIFIRGYIATPAIVNGASMEDTLYDNELVIVNKISLKTENIERFDIVVIKKDNDMIIKRIIGLPNEKIEYINNKLYINDELLELPIKFKSTEDFSSNIKSDEYFVLGDNRSVSKDSRTIGTIKEKEIKGKVKLIIFPFKRFGLVQ